MQIIIKLKTGQLLIFAAAQLTAVDFEDSALTLHYINRPSETYLYTEISSIIMA